MIRTLKMVADDGRVAVAVEARIRSRNGLTRGEVEAIRVSLTRHLAAALPGVIYTDFGADNIAIRGEP